MAGHNAVSSVAPRGVRRPGTAVGKGEPHERPRRSGASLEPASVAPEGVAGWLVRPLGPAQLPDLLGSRTLAQGVKPAPNLIGKLEGAEVVTDLAQLSQDLQGGAKLAELVKAGKLPPVEQRIGQDPSSSSRSARSASTAAPGGGGFTGPVDTSERPPRGPERQAALLRLHGHQDRARTSPAGWEVSPDGRSPPLICAGA